ncbi:MAG: ribonuclease R [Bacteroidota bacterium]
MAKKKVKKGKKLTTKELQKVVYRLFKDNPKKTFNPRQISRRLNIENNRDSIKHALEQLMEGGKVQDLGDYTYKLKGNLASHISSNIIVGKVDMTKTGSAYIVSDQMENDVFVTAKYLNAALHGDQVKVAVWRRRGRNKPEGEILEIVKRATEHFLGTIHISNKYAFVIPDRLNMPVDIYVDLENTKGARDQDKVIVRVDKWHDDKKRSPEGVITSVLGAVGSSDIEMKGILINNGFNLEFSEEVIAEAEKFPIEIESSEVERRRDMRTITTFTIDPNDAKDFDDALSIEYLENGHCEIGVHIADVSHFVKPESQLDKEALSRSTSVYLVDRVLPMLPERLSNGLCSLRPHEDKYTFSAVFEFDKDDKVVNRWFGKTLTHSDHRFTYGAAQKVLDGEDGPFAAELKVMNRIAHKLRKKRFKDGAINFETEEVRFRLDEDGVPIEVYLKERKDAHMLIEDFMLLANREVAGYISEKGKEQEIPFVYRIHDEPDPDKVAELVSFAREMGVEINVGSPKEIARSFNRLTKQAQDDPALKLLGPVAIRTMAKAVYSTDNIGHYGLGFEQYSHFTSPIRRYSDVLAHRILEKNLEGQTYRANKIKLEEKCEHISLMERRAVEAERESIKYKQVEYMERHLGESFEGRVSGIIDRGIFIELLVSRCEGMVSFATMSEPYDVHPSRLRATGMVSRRQIKIGDTVTVKITAADLHRRQIEMEFMDEAPIPDKMMDNFFD